MYYYGKGWSMPQTETPNPQPLKSTAYQMIVKGIAPKRVHKICGGAK